MYTVGVRLDDPVARIMSVPVYTVHVDQPTSAVRRMMREHRFHHVPVVSEGVLVGMVSASDLLHLRFGDFGVQERFLDTVLDKRYPIRELMVRDLVTIGPTEPIVRAAELLSDGRFHALPVVSEGRRIKGLVTSTDLVRFLVHLAAVAEAEGAG